MKLSIIIPAHNEEHRLPPVLEVYAEFFTKKYKDQVELIVVPNFCDDRTALVARDLCERYPVIKVLDDPGQVGKGGAVMLGAQGAKGERVGFVDADGATTPEAFDDLIENIGSAGCIIASRWMKDSIVEPKQPVSRRVASRLFNTLVNVMFGFRVSDTQCGAKLFTQEAMTAILPDLGITRWAFDVDMLFHVRRNGFKIVEIPTVWRDAEGSKVKVVRASADMAVALIRLRLMNSPLKGVVEIYNCLDKVLKK